MKNLLALTVLGVMVLSQFACSSGGSDQINYRGSQITPTLEVPPDLISRRSNDNLQLPGSGVGTAARTGRFVETGLLDLKARTLPTVSGMRIQGQGDWYWLEVDSPAHEVYAQVREFWAEQGFRLQLDEPTIGVMETEWLSMKATSDSFLSGMIASMRAAERKDQYRIRLQRGPQPEMTMVSISHRGQEQIIGDEGDVAGETKTRWQGEIDKGWQWSPMDPAKEYEMLSRLMIFLGLRQPDVQKELEKIGLFAARARLAFYDDENDESNTYLLVKQGFDQTWNRLQHQMDRLSIKPQQVEKDDNEATLVLAAGEIMSDFDADQENLNLSVKGARGTDSTRIEVLNDNGSINPSDEARQALQFLLQQLK